MAKTYQHFGIIGAGAWGTALATSLLRARRSVTLWAHEPDVANSIQTLQENKFFLPGVKLDPALKATSHLEDLAGCDALVLVVPAQHTRAVAKRLADLKLQALPPLILASKGIEQESSALLSDVIADELPRHALAILSGPSFAGEIARGLPAALTLASKDRGLGEPLMKAMAAPAFRLYLTDDVIGAQVGGAVKNVLAVACGIIAGRQMGENARAAIITRGLAEMNRLGVAMGGRAETLMGLSGLGDLVLTCSSPQSRNMSLGMDLGRGKALQEILSARTSVAEGVTTAAAALGLAQKYRIEMPIVDAVHAVLHRKADIETTIAGLLARPLREE